ncbi:MAG: LPXTG cell wall anchor domain-containing protein [Clostridia bacterium]|nr:LPXTG cell wall anchor domain-containing protein [Clostridia bacterium]
MLCDRKASAGIYHPLCQRGEYASVTDRCCDGGTIINKKIPKTGDETPILLWAGMLLIGAAGITVALTANKRRKAHK